MENGAKLWKKEEEKTNKGETIVEEREKRREKVQNEEKEKGKEIWTRKEKVQKKKQAEEKREIWREGKRKRGEVKNE